jgi:small-conductance mechanosensitive channel
MRYTFLGNSVEEWGAALAVMAAAVVLLYLIKCLAVRRLAVIAERTHTAIDDWLVRALRKTWLLTIVVGGAWLGSQMLDLPPKPQTWMWRIAVTTLLLQGGVWADSLVRSWRGHYRARDEQGASATSAAIIDFVLRMVVWTVFILMVLDNLGFNITTLVASLGISGIAVALAVQNILGDLFASLSIVLDKPFVVGDFIIVDDKLGTVEYIGLKTTRLRGLGGDQIIFSNGDILRARILNQTRMHTRRAAFILRVRHGTTEEQLREIPQILKQAVLTQEETATFERSHFSGLGEWSFDFETVYWIKSPDYFVFMDTQQAIYLRVVGALAERGIELAIPMRLMMPPAALPAAWQDKAPQGTIRTYTAG